MLFTEPRKPLNCAGEVIAHAIDSEWATSKQLCALMETTTSTLSRWTLGESGPSFDQVARVVRGHADPRVQMLFAGALCATTPIVLSFADAAADFNGDGEINGCDAVCAMVEGAAKAMNALREVSKRVNAGKGKCTFTPGDAMTIREQIDATVRLLSSAARIVDLEAEKTAKKGVRR